MEADAEALPFADGEFDKVLSCLGVMFAPHHQTGADELARVCRPGGTIGLLSWTPEGFIGQMFATMKPYAPPPSPGAQPPPLWGNSRSRSRSCSQIASPTLWRAGRPPPSTASHRPTEFRDYFKANYGPTIAVYNSLTGQPDRIAALDRDLVELSERFDRGSGTTVMDWEYLLLTARKRT